MIRLKLNLISSSYQNKKFFAGECKTGSKLGDKDLATARLAAEFGIHHYYFCTIKRFDIETHGKIRALKKDLAANNYSMTIEALNGKKLIGDVVE